MSRRGCAAALVMAVGLLGSFVARAHAQPATVDDIIAAFDRDCVPGQMTSAACQASREGAERLLLMQLEYLTAQGQRVDPAMLREAAQARWPSLQRFGLQRLAVVGPAPADAALGEAALESPYAGVRRAGLAVLQTLDGPRWHPLAVRDYGPGTGSKREPSLDMVPDVQPDAAALGAPLYPASTYSFLMSGLRRPVFVTSDPPDRVVAFYAQGRRSYTRPELEAAIRAAQQPDPADLAARAMRGEDVRKLAEEIQQAALAAPDVAAWASGIQGQSGVETPRYVPIEERPVLGKTMPVRAVVIFADRVLGKTAIVFPRDPARAANYFSRDAVLDRAFAQRLFSRPLPMVEGPDPTR